MNKRDYKIILPIFICLGFFSTAILFSSMYQTQPQDEKIKTTAETIEIDISSDQEALEEDVYLVGSELTFKIDDNGYSAVKIKFEGVRHLYQYDMNKGTGVWTYIWDTENPNAEEESVEPDTYKIILEIDGDEKDTNPEEITISTGEDEFPIWIIIIIIGSIAAVIIISGFMVVKKRKAKEEKLEFNEARKSAKKKKGKVYSGASAIGKRSGVLAEDKTKKKVVDSSSSTKSSKKISKPSGFIESKSMHKPFGIDRKKKTTPDFKFEQSTSKNIAMLKNMEMKMGLEEKIGFLISKAEAINRNVEFFKAILSQQEQDQYICPNCNHQITVDLWPKCPYCEIADFEVDLELKQSVLSISEGLRFCSDCKRVIQPEWVVCPYCYH